MSWFRPSLCLLAPLLMALMPCKASAEALDRWLRLSPPQHRTNPWDNIELQVVTKFPRLRFDVGGVVSYEFAGIRLGVNYQGGHPAYACEQAPFLAIPLRIPFPLTPMDGMDFALGVNVPVIAMGGGARAPVEMNLALTMQVDAMMHALGSMHPLTYLFKPSEPEPVVGPR